MKKQKKEVCTIELGNGILDNEYTVFEDGSIRHFYDRNTFAFNIEEWTTVDELSEGTKGRLIEKCPSGSKTKLRKLLKL